MKLLWLVICSSVLGNILPPGITNPTTSNGPVVVQSKFSMENLDPLFGHHTNIQVQWDRGEVFRELGQWHLYNSGVGSTLYSNGIVVSNLFEPATFRADIHALEAWQFRRESPDVIVAVIENGGIDSSHPDLATNMIPGIDVRLGIVSTNKPPISYHGTQVAGVIGGVATNGVGIHGVTWKVKMMPLRHYSISDDLAICIDYAVSNGAKIINYSNGDPMPYVAVSNALWRAYLSNVIFVCAAPNAAQNVDDVPDYPASWKLPNVIVTTSTTPTDTLYIPAGFGTNTVHIGAPGRLIVTTWGNGEYRYSGGTSLAAPQVSGVLALLTAEYPNDSLEERLDRLCSSCDQIIPQVKYGRLNAGAALAWRPITIKAGSVRCHSMYSWSLQFSTNFVEWTTVASNVTQGFSMSVGQGVGFYRLVR